MATLTTRLVGKVRQAALQAGARGVRYLVEGTTAAAKTVDQWHATLTERLEAHTPARTTVETVSTPPPSTPEPALSAQARATAEELLQEARAVEQRIRGARTARHPLRISVTAEPEAPPRSRGRKTTAAATSPKRASAPKAGAPGGSTGGFKAKRGQKHR
ncbi:hypothetical protein [Archangium primigenium]|uniref:hypothetical protein n=1 Tax=[Archangium] primigenium TaxID=2792470 RepID=UPI0019588895|nr:hypothetical protein [Archangium primigenium]MBM7112670.1 hypothetical protein [Archangium primigenium]